MSDTKVSHIMVEIEKMVSDGNYGRERIVVQFTADLNEGEDAQHLTTLLLSQARNRLYHELGKSESLTVRRAINPPPRLCDECKMPLSDNDDYSHPACYEVRAARRKREDEERREQYRQQRELVAVGAHHDALDGNGDEDEDERKDVPL